MMASASLTRRARRASHHTSYSWCLLACCTFHCLALLCWLAPSSNGVEPTHCARSGQLAILRGLHPTRRCFSRTCMHLPLGWLVQCSACSSMFVKSCACKWRFQACATSIVPATDTPAHKKAPRRSPRSRMRRAPALAGAPSAAAVAGETSCACGRIGACAARGHRAITSSARGVLCSSGMRRW
jgi:hypothetical protein